MARTIDPVAHAERRDAILAAGEMLIVGKGYESMTINDVLEATGISKGAFYHYFHSKDDLLQGLLTRRLDRWSSVVTVAAGQAATPTERLRAVAEALGAAKTSDRVLLIRALPRMFGTENHGLYARLRRAAVDRFLPTVTEVVADGAEAGDFSVTSVDGTSRVVMSLLQEYSEVSGRHLYAMLTGDDTMADLDRDARAFSDAIELVLGMTPGEDPFIPVAERDEWSRALAMAQEEQA